MTEENTTVVNTPIESREPDAQTEGRVQKARGEQANYLHVDEAPFLDPGLDGDTINDLGVDVSINRNPSLNRPRPAAEAAADLIHKEENREPELPAMITWQGLMTAFRERRNALPESLHSDFAAHENYLRGRIMEVTGNAELDRILMGENKYSDTLNETVIPAEFEHDIRRLGINPFISDSGSDDVIPKEAADLVADLISEEEKRESELDFLAEVVAHVRETNADGRIAVLSNSDVVDQQAHHVIFTVGRTKFYNLPEIVIIGAPVDLAEHVIEYMARHNVSLGDHRECSISGAINRVTGQDIVLANLKRADLTWLIDGLVTKPEFIERNVRMQSGMDDIFNIVYDDQPVVIDILSSIVFPWVQEPYGALDNNKNQSDLALLQVLASFDYEAINLDTVEDNIGTEPAND